MSGGDIVRVLRRAWLLGLFCLVVGIVGGVLGLGFTAAPPVVIQDMHDVDKVVIRGGWLRLHTTFRKNRECQNQVHRFLWQWIGEAGHSDRRWIIIGETSSPPAPIGVNTSSELDLPVPGDISAGKWYYRAVYRQNCDWGGRFGWLGSLFDQPEHSTVDIPIPIENPPEGKPTQIVAPPGPVTILPGAAGP